MTWLDPTLLVRDPEEKGKISFRDPSSRIRSLSPILDNPSLELTLGRQGPLVDLKWGLPDASNRLFS